MDGVPDGVEDTVELDGLRLATVSYGPPDAPVVLCLHGWLDNGASFAPLAAAMPQQRLVVLELPGHGHSDHLPPGCAYHVLDWVVWVLEAMDAMGLSRVQLMGHSMGAGIAVLTAGTCPARVSQLVLLEGMGPRSGAAEDLPTALLRHVDGRRQLRLRAKAPARGAQFSIAVRARLAASFALSEQAATLLAERGVRPASGGVVFRNDRRLQAAGPGRLSEDQIVSFFRRVACPALLILGDKGLRQPSHIMEARLAALPSAEVVTVPGGHHVHMDDPLAVVRHVEPFLKAGRAS